MNKWALFFILFLLSATSRADVLVDTDVYGCTNTCGGYGLTNTQSLAAMFSVTQAVSITDISLYMVTQYDYTADLTLALYQDINGVPDSSLEIFLTTLNVVDNSTSGPSLYQWEGVSNLDWDLSSGNYWLALEVRSGQTYNGYLPTGQYGAINSASAYAFNNSYIGGGWHNTPQANFGLRINTNTVAVSSPSTLILFLVGGLALLRFKRNSTDLQGKIWRYLN